MSGRKLLPRCQNEIPTLPTFEDRLEGNTAALEGEWGKFVLLFLELSLITCRPHRDTLPCSNNPVTSFLPLYSEEIP